MRPDCPAVLKVDTADPELSRAELARRAEVPEFIVDVVVSAGLVLPIGEPGSERFSADAVDMLVAARTLVDSGISLEELTALALRHATHVEEVVDDALELFRRRGGQQRNPAGEDRDDLLALMHELVPVASSLVGRHFERTLRTRALARLGDEPTDGPMVVHAHRLKRRLDPVSVYLDADDHYRMLWVRPDERLAIVGLGSVEVIEPHGDARFSAASAARVALAARVRREGPPEAPSPVLMGGFSFRSGSIRSGSTAPAVIATQPIQPGGAKPSDYRVDWDGYPDARWVLPELTIIDRADGTWLLTASRRRPGEAEQTDALRSRIDSLIALEPHEPVGDVVGGAPTVNEAHGVAYTQLVSDAVAEISSGRLDKVVPARVQESDPVDLSLVLPRLVARYPGCAVVAVGVADRDFISASPERLVALNGGDACTVALAGTARRGVDTHSDDALATAMLSSEKIRREHQFVVDDLTDRLGSLGLIGETPAEPEVLRLVRVQHLCTPITARIRRRRGVSDMDVLRLAGVLHPTPAVAGVPTEAALRWIFEHEGFDRGWYAGPVGWCDLDGNGELRVALRSALLSPARALLFAGAGVVSDSDPDDELAETAVKLRAMLDVMQSS